MTDDITTTGEAGEESPSKKKRGMNINIITIFLVLAFLLVLLAESATASMITPGEGIINPRVNFTKEYLTCLALGKSEGKCQKTATAWANKTPTEKNCSPYKHGRAVSSGETFEQYISYYRMTDTQRDEFIKINSLSPAYPNTVIYTGVRYCLPYGVNKKGAEGTDTGSFNPSADFGWYVSNINGSEITFDLVNWEKYDKVNVWYWKKPPGASGMHCLLNIDGDCVQFEYNTSQKFDDGYSDTRKIWLGLFKLTTNKVTLVFPRDVEGWNRVYVCMHSLFRSEADEDSDASQAYATYHSYCQFINLSREATTRIIRPPAATQTGTITPTATVVGTPCGWDGISYICEPPCPGTVIPTPTNTLCIWPAATEYWVSCPGTRIPPVPLDWPIFTPTAGPGTPGCYVTPTPYLVTVTKTPTAKNTPCGWVTDQPICMPACPGTRRPTPTNTPCATQYGASCPGLRKTEDPPYDPIYTPTGQLSCTPYWSGYSSSSSSR